MTPLTLPWFANTLDSYDHRAHDQIIDAYRRLKTAQLHSYYLSSTESRQSSIFRPQPLSVARSYWEWLIGSPVCFRLLLDSSR